MGRRLIIRHGERVTRHEVPDKGIVIGRDPGCDLFFSDHRLSRRHARIELEANGLRLVDLGSRNGCWVNEKRVDECVLEPSDDIRLGGLRLSYEEDLPTTPMSQDEDDSRTIQVSASGSLGRPAGVEPPDDTMLFVESSLPDKDSTLVLSDSVPDVEDTGTVVFTEEGQTGTTTRSIPVLDKTKPVAEESEAAEEDLPRLTEATMDGQSDAKDTIYGFEQRRPSILAFLVVAGSSLLVYLLLAVPLLFMTRAELFRESLHRGETLFHLLRTKNAPFLGTGQLQKLSVETVLSEPGVKQAVILSPDGRIAAPRDRAGDPHDTIEGLSVDIRDVERVQQSETGSGDLVFVGPLFHDQRRVGMAVMVYSLSPMARGPWLPLVVVVGLFVLVAGVIAAYTLDKSDVGTSSTAGSETTLAESAAAPPELETRNSRREEDG